MCRDQAAGCEFPRSSSAPLTDIIFGAKFTDRKTTDIFAIQDDIARAIVNGLKLRLVPQGPLIKRHTENVEAYNQWLKGRYYQHNRETLDALASSKECFAKAIVLDPNYAPAYLGLAEHFREMAFLGFSPAKAAASQGRSLVLKALDLDGNLGEAHAMLGVFHGVFEFDWEAAEQDFRRALALSPASPVVHSRHAMYLLVPKQRLDEAEAELELTLGADPLSPDYHAQLAQIHLFKRQFDRAEEKARAAIELKSNYPFAYWLVGVIRALQGRFDQAISNCENAIQLFGGAPVAIAAVGTLLGWAGCVAEVRKMLERVEAAARTSYVSSVARAWIHMGLGETDKVFEWLDRAVDERDPQITHLPVKPIYDSLRADPRFAALLHKMRL